MSYIRSILAAFLVLALVGCSSPTFFRASSLSSTIQDVNVTSIVISKKNRRMYLFDGKTVLRSYKIGLGSEPVGDKKVQGDGKTPEGLYYIDRKNPKSRYYLSLGISYPN